MSIVFNEQLRLQIGINNKNFHYLIESGETFVAPEVVMTCTDKGLSDLSHIYHDFIRSNLNKSRFMHEERPILINTWEAVFFEFDDKKLVEVAKAAKEMGVEMLVMDDGWFGKRDNDKSGLGDWYVNKEKIHCGLHELVKQINDLGMKFGIWFEPESISVDSDLYRAHPDWALEIPGRAGAPYGSGPLQNHGWHHPNPSGYPLRGLFRRWRTFRSGLGFLGLPGPFNLPCTKNRQKRRIFPDNT